MKRTQADRNGKSIVAATALGKAMAVPWFFFVLALDLNGTSSTHINTIPKEQVIFNVSLRIIAANDE